MNILKKIYCKSTSQSSRPRLARLFLISHICKIPGNIIFCFFLSKYLCSLTLNFGKNMTFLLFLILSSLVCEFFWHLELSFHAYEAENLKRMFYVLLRNYIISIMMDYKTLSKNFSLYISPYSKFHAKWLIALRPTNLSAELHLIIWLGRVAKKLHF